MSEAPDAPPRRIKPEPPPDPPRGPLGRLRAYPGRFGSLLLLSLPIIVIAALAWRRRWISDDGWINMRVLQQWDAGNGPVFNAGERVEVGTSTLWLWALRGVGLIFPDATHSQISIILGIAFMVGAFTLATVAASRLARTGEYRITALLPLGTVVWVALPPMWDFTTSGLETSLNLFWMALCFHLLVARLNRPRHRQEGAFWPIWPALVIGLGWLVRPDAALFSAFFALALLLQSKVSVLSWLGALGLALPIPVGYQIWRMGYYAALVPNTALAKSAGAANIDAGLYYFQDFIGLYAVWFPVAIGLFVVIDRLRHTARLRDVGRMAVLLAPVVAGLLHGAYIIRVGGDFMHGRFLLPATFAVLLPVACIGLSNERRGVLAAATALLLGWAMVAAGVTTRYDTSIDLVGRNTGRPTLEGIANERTFWVNSTRHHRAITLQDWRGSYPAQTGLLARMDAERHRTYYQEHSSGERYETATGVGVIVSHNNMGITSMFAGPRVKVLDQLALADAVTARTRPDEVTDSAQRTGHAPRNPAWRLARYAAPDPEEDLEVTDARAALQCGDLATLQAAITEPMTQERFWQNVEQSGRLTFLQYPENPTEARMQLCGWTPPQRH